MNVDYLTIAQWLLVPIAIGCSGVIVVYAWRMGERHAAALDPHGAEPEPYVKPPLRVNLTQFGNGEWTAQVGRKGYFPFHSEHTHVHEDDGPPMLRRFPTREQALEAGRRAHAEAEEWVRQQTPVITEAVEP